jgi:hypothetical protein
MNDPKNDAKLESLANRQGRRGLQYECGMGSAELGISAFRAEHHVICKETAKKRGHEMKNAENIGGSGLWKASCRWNFNGCCKYLIFSRLGMFCSIFHPFFTLCFSRNNLIFRHLHEMHRHKRHASANAECEIRSLTTDLPRRARARRVDTDGHGF